MSKRSAWLCEYEQLCNTATSSKELQNLSIQYISRQREDLLSQIEHCKTEAEHSHAEAERSHAEAEKLRDVLKRLRTELEVRAPRFARTDHEDLRAIVNGGLRQTNCEASAAEESSGNVMKRLRARVEQLERANKRLEKECDTHKLQKLVAQRDLQRAGLDPGKTKNVSAVGGGHQQQRSPRISSRVLMDDTLGNMSSPSPPRATASSPATRSRILSSEDLEAAPSDERERRLSGEREHLLAMVLHMEKEQAEQQQYADQVVNQLGHALRTLEADNSTLQEESKQHCQKLGASAEARRKLDRQVKQLRSEKEALARQLMSLRSGALAENKASGNSRYFRPSRSKSPNPVSAIDKVAARTAENGATAPDKIVSKVRRSMGKSDEKLENEAAGSQPIEMGRTSASTELWSHEVQDLQATIELTPPSDPSSASLPQQSWGLAWRSFESDGTLEDSPTSPLNSSAILTEPTDIAAASEATDPPTQTLSKDELMTRAEGSREPSLQRVEPPAKDRATQPATPAWANLTVSATAMLPRVSSPGRVDVRLRQASSSPPPKRVGSGSGTSVATHMRNTANRSPRLLAPRTHGT